MRTLYHQEIGGGYSNRRKIIVDAAEIRPEEFEIMALRAADGEELETVIVHNEVEAKKAYDEMLSHYLEPLQRAVFDGKLVPGEKYTLFHLGEFGFPIAWKITLLDYEYTTYAQYSDVVKLTFKMFRKRNTYQHYLHHESFAIFKGWQDLKKEDMVNVLSEENGVKTVMSKYSCFDSRYIEDGLSLLENPVVIYKNYKTGANGKIYA